MATKTPTNENPSKPKTTLKPAAKILKAATLKIEEVTVLEIDYLVQARKFVSRKKIHRRREIRRLSDNSAAQSERQTFLRFGLHFAERFGTIGRNSELYFVWKSE